MRILRFRAKRLDNGEWVYGHFSLKLNTLYYKLIPSIQIVLPNGNVLARIEVDGETVGQFTGETDKNDKDIFEGDIVKYIIPRNNKTVIGVVNYGRGCFGIKDINSPNNPAIDIVLNESDIEIIGNKYDNPELLGGENIETN
jgi:uncharacterized phage protein (TIGR01671 family)